MMALPRLEAIKEFAPDVVVLDIGLPGMDGYQVARLIRDIPEFRQIILIALTGYGQEFDRQRSKAAGFDKHLVKPVQFSDIEDLLVGLEQPTC